jgi:Protein of unknown function (DUF3108)
MSRFIAVCAVMAAAAHSAPPAALGQVLPLDTARAAPQADTFALLVNGREVGRQVVSLAREGGGFLFRETTTTSAGHQTTEVRMDGALRMLSTHQEGEMGGQPMRIHVEYGDGRATGEARIPGAAGTEDVDVDAAVPAAVVDDNVLMALLPALPLEPGAAVELPVFSAGTNTLTSYTLRVSEAEPITVPAGEFEAYRVEVSGGARPLVLHVAAAAPHRLLRLIVTGAPMELVRTGPPHSSR